MIFRTPVTKPLHEFGWKRPSGSVDFRVTQEYGCTGVPAEPKLGTCAHFHRGLDLGNGRCGDDVVAAAAGEVQFAGALGNGEIMVVLDHGGGWGTAYSHLRRATVAKGDMVNSGGKVGEIGDTGFAQGCHLHWGTKSDLPAGFTRLDFIPEAFGGRGDSTGKWRDPWPLLRQNQPEDDMPPLAAYIPGHQATVGAGFNVRAAPSTSGQVLRTLQAPETWVAFGWAKGESVSGSDEWLVRWAGKYEYVHRSGVTSVMPPGDCTAAVKAATDPLKATLNAANAQIAAQNTKLAQIVSIATT